MGRKKEEREKGDERILSSGNFVIEVLAGADSSWERKQKYEVLLGELISRINNGLGVQQREIVSAKRGSRISDARAIICYLAVMELDVKGVHVGKALKLSGQSVSRCIDRGKILPDHEENLYQYLQIK